MYEGREKVAPQLFSLPLDTLKLLTERHYFIDFGDNSLLLLHRRQRKGYPKCRLFLSRIEIFSAQEPVQTWQDRRQLLQETLSLNAGRSGCSR